MADSISAADLRQAVEDLADIRAAGLESDFGDDYELVVAETRIPATDAALHADLIGGDVARLLGADRDVCRAVARQVFVERRQVAVLTLLHRYGEQARRGRVHVVGRDDDQASAPVPAVVARAASHAVAHRVRQSRRRA